MIAWSLNKSKDITAGVQVILFYLFYRNRKKLNETLTLNIIRPPCMPRCTCNIPMTSNPWEGWGPCHSQANLLYPKKTRKTISTAPTESWTFYTNSFLSFTVLNMNVYFYLTRKYSFVSPISHKFSLTFKTATPANKIQVTKIKRLFCIFVIVLFTFLTYGADYACSVKWEKKKRQSSQV